MRNPGAVLPQRQIRAAADCVGPHRAYGGGMEHWSTAMLTWIPLLFAFFVLIAVTMLRRRYER